jgi:ribokinase
VTTRRIVVVGDLVTDVVVRLRAPMATASDTAADIRTGGGGSGANVAAWLAHMGADVSFVGRVGDDGTVRVSELAALGVTTRVVRDGSHHTGTVVVMVEAGGERTMLTDRGAAGWLRPGDLPDDAFVPGAHLHLSGYLLLDVSTRAAGLAALARAKQAGMSTSLDP